MNNYYSELFMICYPSQRRRCSIKSMLNVCELKRFVSGVCVSPWSTAQGKKLAKTVTWFCSSFLPCTLFMQNFHSKPLLEMLCVLIDITSVWIVVAKSLCWPGIVRQDSCLFPDAPTDLCMAFFSVSGHFAFPYNCQYQNRPKTLFIALKLLQFTEEN